MMRHGSLFSGIGGFDLAAEWMGWENVFHCECNPFGQKVLNHYWPKAETFTDITKSDFTKYNGTIDIISGGFPCQPYSAAGKRKGKEDERHLWPEMLRAIREISPRWVVGENVRGLTNWNGGMVFDEVQADLEFEGYEVTPFLLPAVAVNAPHRRDRIWFIAYSNHDGRSKNTERFGARHLHLHGFAADTYKCTKGSSGTCGSTQSNRGKNNDEQEQRGEQAEQHNRPHELLRTITDTDGNVHPGGLDYRGNIEAQAGSKGENEQQGGWDENRKRVWVELGAGCQIAPNAESDRKHRAQEPENCNRQSGERGGCDVDNISEVSRQDGSADATDTNSSERCKRGLHPGGHQEAERHAGTRDARHNERNTWDNFPTQSPLCSRNDGFPPELDRTSIFNELGIEHPRKPAISFAKWRNESIKAYGNAVVPQVPFEIFKAIEQYERTR